MRRPPVFLSAVLLALVQAAPGSLADLAQWAITASEEQTRARITAHLLTMPVDSALVAAVQEAFDLLGGPEDGKLKTAEYAREKISEGRAGLNVKFARQGAGPFPDSFLREKAAESFSPVWKDVLLKAPPAVNRGEYDETREKVLGTLMRSAMRFTEHARRYEVLLDSPTEVRKIRERIEELMTAGPSTGLPLITEMRSGIPVEASSDGGGELQSSPLPSTEARGRGGTITPSSLLPGPDERATPTFSRPLPSAPAPTPPPETEDEETGEESEESDYTGFMKVLDRFGLAEYFDMVFGAFVSVVLSTLLMLIFGFTGQLLPAITAAGLAAVSFWRWSVKTVSMVQKLVVGTMTTASAGAVVAGSEMLGVIALLCLTVALVQGFLSGSLIQEAVAAVTPPGSRPGSGRTTPVQKKKVTLDAKDQEIAGLKAALSRAEERELAAAKEASRIEAGMPQQQQQQQQQQQVQQQQTYGAPQVGLGGVNINVGGAAASSSSGDGPPANAGSNFMSAANHFVAGGPATGPLTGTGASAGLPGPAGIGQTPSTRPWNAAMPTPAAGFNIGGAGLAGSSNDPSYLCRCGLFQESGICGVCGWGWRVTYL